MSQVKRKRRASDVSNEDDLKELDILYDGFVETTGSVEINFESDIVQEKKEDFSAFLSIDSVDKTKVERTSDNIIPVFKRLKNDEEMLETTIQNASDNNITGIQSFKVGDRICPYKESLGENTSTSINIIQKLKDNPICPYDGSIVASTTQSAIDNFIIGTKRSSDEAGSNSESPSESGDGDDENMEIHDNKEELAMTMRGFDVLDDLDPNDDFNDDQDSDIQSDGSFDSDVPQDEIEAMLEEGLLKGTSTTNETAPVFEEREKIVLEELGHNHFDVLPEGWVQVTHNSGMPIYLHRQSRVCTLAKPYFLGPGSARKHEVPLSGIPCLQYQRAMEDEKTEKELQKHQLEKLADENAAIIADGIGTVRAPALPSARIETAQENKEAQSLTAQQVQDYCRRRFGFKSVRVMRFKSWSDRRKFTKRRKHEKQLQRPTLPEGTKLIKFPVQNADGTTGGSNGSNRSSKEWIMNPNGKSYVCILHEYVQHALKKQPSYQFKELENAATPYSATVTINVMQYGVGYGTSKKQAKSDAAKATLEILIPEMRDKIQEDSRVGARGTSKGQDTDLSFFDEIKIEDPRVAELCAKTTEPSPYVILLTCLQRNFGMGEMHVNYDVNSVRHQKNEFKMTVGRHSASVICKNKRDGKQRASQQILQLLHPHVASWGSLLRLYGNRSVKNIKEKKQDEQEITLLQSKASINSPNFAILEKLSAEMLTLKKRKAEVQPIGKFVTNDLPTANGADLNNVDL